MSATWRVVCLSFLIAIAGEAAAQTGQKQPLPEKMVLMMFGGGIVVIALSWVAIPAIFAWRNELDQLIDLLRRGAIMRFVTVTYIVIVAVTLAIVDRLDGDKVATLLASIAGYVLGQATSHRESSEDADERKAKKQRDAGMVTDSRLRPSPPATGSAS